MEFKPLAKQQRDFGRVTEIVKALVRYGLADWMKPLPFAGIQDFFKSRQGEVIADVPMAVRLRMAFAELGPTFIKLGQLLSTRPDLVGADVAMELSNLQANALADPVEEICKIIEEDLGARPEALFSWFDPVAFASASMAQVHHARLRTGEEVVVKVQRPGIREKVEADLSILAWLAEQAENHAPQVRCYQPREVVRQFHRTLRLEMDFVHERRNMEEFIHRFSNDPMVKFATPWAEYSSKRVLTMERLDGISGYDYEKLQASGADLNAFALRGANMYLEMIFRDSFYHADPHPGNLMLLPNGVVGVLDCGMTGRLDERVRTEIENLIIAFTQADPLALAGAVMRLVVSPPSGDREQLVAELSEFVAEHTARPIGELEITPALYALTGIIRRHHLILPASVSLLLRTLILLEGTSKVLNPQFSLSSVIKPYYRRALRRRMSPKRFVERLNRSFRDWDSLIQTLPNDLSEMIQRVRMGKFQVHLDHRHLDPVINRLVLGIVVASLFLGSSLLWSTKAPPVVWDVSIFGAAGYAIAVYLGWKLFRAIRRSGDIRSDNDEY